MNTSKSGRDIDRVDPQVQDDFVAVPYLRKGQLVSLIRWTKVKGEWKYTTLLGEYLHRDEGSWYLIVEGKQAQLDREQWAIFN